MATEGPLMHDGAQNVAAGSWINGKGLAGPSGSAQFLAVVQSTQTDRTVVLAAALGQQAYGILQNKPDTGYVADIGFYGISKALAAGAITRGDRLMTSTNGGLITWASGAASAQVGHAIESASSGSLFTAFIYGPTAPKVLT